MFPEIVGLGFFGMMMLVGFASSVAAVLLMAYALYDLIAKQDDLVAEEKLVWAVVILVFNLIGAIVYFLAVWTGFTGFLETNELNELERLAELRDDGALSNEEFNELKKELIEDMRD